MAHYRLSVKIISRGKGQSVVAASAYRAGEKLRDEELIYRTKAKHQERLDKGVISERFKKQLGERGVELSGKACVVKEDNCWVIRDGQSFYTVRQQMTGKGKDKPQLSIYRGYQHDYSNRGGVLHTEIMTPDGAPSWAGNRGSLWNAVQSAEKREDAQLAREVQLSLPRELDLEQQKKLVREFARENFVKHGMCCDIAIHESEASDGGKNPHAHILLTMRDISQRGFTDNKNRQWNKKASLKNWRKSWADMQNEHLAMVGSIERVDHQSYEARGIEQIPQVHMGKEAWNLEKKGTQTKLGDINREIGMKNRLIAFLRDDSSGISVEKIQEVNRVMAHYSGKAKEKGRSIFDRFIGKGVDRGHRPEGRGRDMDLFRR